MTDGPPEPAELPEISVVVPTRGRPDHAAECVASILACDDGYFTITVIDQSDDDQTGAALAELGDARVRRVATATRGAATARNVGVAETDGPIIAFTDDDCRVDTTWLRAFRDVLIDERVGMVFGGVEKGPTDDPTAQAAEFLPTGTETYESLPPVSRPWGISASLAIRRRVFDEVGGFDTRLGPGAPIDTGGEDSDLFIRVLAADRRVGTTDATTVIHLGFRSGDEAAALYRGYAFALGAVFAKHLRLWTRPGREQLPKWVAHFGLQTVANTIQGRRPTGAGFSLGLLKGAIAGLRIPVDPSTRRFA